jgi:hypothetical protein
MYMYKSGDFFGGIFLSFCENYSIIIFYFIFGKNQKNFDNCLQYEKVFDILYFHILNIFKFD